MPNPSEAKTRKELIDPAIRAAGWKLDDPSQVGIEIPVDGYDAEPWNGITDYALYQPNGEVIAVIEAKRTLRDPRLAQQQAQHYVTEIEKHQSFRPFAFLTNGHEIYFWDSAVDEAKRRVYGFFSPNDLERLKFAHEQGLSLSTASINSQITNRPYQHEAIRRICEAFEHEKKRRALLVMATGTGKTRTAMSIIDLFMRSNQAQNILFVADRDALVEQAINDGFKKYLPSEPCERIWSNNINEVKDNRLFAATLQTLSNCFEQFTPAFFDLIIFDEVHRSIFNKFFEVVEYFDGRMIGLTATPADFIERNTFRIFGCNDQTPTFLYGYDQAIQDGYLVDYQVYVANTHFQRAGIHGIDLTEQDRNLLIEQGYDPDAIDFSGTELEQTVSNRDTLRRQWEEIWNVCMVDQSGQLPGKTIVFAMTQDHALRLEEVFNEMYPQFGSLCRVITYKSEYRGQSIEDFKREDMPRIAISVDMLDTGVDIPEVVNLVFMRPVTSRIKLMQMIGRGTRSHEACMLEYQYRLPDGKKTGFLVIDFWQNDFNRTAVERETQTLPVLVTIFNTRLDILETLLDRRDSDEARRTISDLRAQVASIPRDSFSVRKVWPQVEIAWADEFWRHLKQEDIDFLRLKVGPLLRYVPGVDVAAATFTSKVERLKFQIMTYNATPSTAEAIAEDVSYLPEFVSHDAKRKAAIDFVLSNALTHATPAELDSVIDQLADQMRHKRASPNPFLMLDLPDYTEVRGYIHLTQRNVDVYVEDYRDRVEQHIHDLVASHPTIQAIERGEPVEDMALIELERTLQRELIHSEFELSQENLRRAFGLKTPSMLGLLRNVLGLENLPDYDQVVRQAFEAFIQSRNFNADQIRFLQAVQNVFLQKHRLVMADLYDPPFTSFGRDAVERWFSKEQVSSILALTDSLAA